MNNKMAALLISAGLFAGGSSNRDQNTLTLSASNANQAKVNESIAIVCDGPQDLNLTLSDFKVSGGKLSGDPSSDDLQFEADKAGTYTISVDKDGLKSNLI